MSLVSIQYSDSTGTEPNELVVKNVLTACPNGNFQTQLLLSYHFINRYDFFLQVTVLVTL